mmetsp:Transcript_30697/g.67410  ORF Transcript_30697/g.67410 Transcript_30697/m.67410 type:complete len:531 (+) Transcript_30697:211-1803(+)
MASTRRAALIGSRTLERCAKHVPHTAPKRRCASSTSKPLLATARNNTKGYQSIGSFHAESVEVLATQPDELYASPELPFHDCSATSLPLPTSNNYDYGDDFYLDRTNWTFLNHGAFGAALKCGDIRANSWRQHLESQPLRYFDRDLLPHLAHSNRVMAEFVNGRKEAMALIQNATVGLNAAIGGYTRDFGSDSLIFYLDVSYGSVKKMVKHYSIQVGGSVVDIPFQDQYLPLEATSKDEAEAIFADAFEKAIDSAKKQGHIVKNSLLVLDHTTSNTAINIPIEALTRRAKGHGMLVLVDGAHGLLAQDLDMAILEEAGVDFYVGNCHKWLSAPRGAAILYCPDGHLRDSVLRLPPSISHGVDDGYLSRFLWGGCRDYSAQLCLPLVLQYWNRIGTDNVRHEMRDTLSNAIEVLMSLWHPHTRGISMEELSAAGITVAPMPMHSPMAVVRLPDNISGNPRTGSNSASSNSAIRTSADAKQMQDFLFENGVECPVKCIGGVLYVRISCHVYNTIEEYERLGRAALQFIPTGW